MPEHATGAARTPSPAWQRWTVRAALCVAIAWAGVVAVRLFTQAATGRDAGQLVWGITATIGGLGLGWALISSLRRRLRARSWMPVVCLLLVVGMATVVA